MAKTNIHNSVSETLTLAEATKNAAQTAPSLPAMKAEQAKLSSLASLYQEVDAEVDSINAALSEQKDADAKKRSVIQELLATGKITSKLPTKQDLLEACRKREAIVEAQKVQLGILHDLSIRYSREVNAALRPHRQRLVTAMAAALKTLRTAGDEEAAGFTALTECGVKHAEADRVAFYPVSNDGGFDRQWFDGVRSMGYTT